MDDFRLPVDDSHGAPPRQFHARHDRKSNDGHDPRSASGLQHEVLSPTMTGGFEVTVTGMGLVVPLGLGVDEVWGRSVRGESAIGPLRRFDTSAYPCSAGAEPAPFELASALGLPKNEKFMSPSVRCALRAAKEAVAASGLDLAAVDPYRIALYTGSGQTGLESAEMFGALEFQWTGDEEKDFANMGGRASRLVDRYFSLRSLSNAGLGLLSAEIGAMGPSDNFVQGDTASALAVSSAVHDLLEGRADVAVVGGYESLLNVSTFLAYEKAGLLSPSDPARAYRPFDRERDGIVLGEGAAFVVLERAEDARRRGATILGEIASVGSAMEAVDAADAKASEGAMRTAVAQAVGDARIDLVVAHGIGTAEGDRREARLIASLVPSGVPVTAFKSQTGYLGAASALAEACLALQALRRGCVPPIARHAGADPDCTLNLVAGRARPLRTERATALCLSWSWLGQCAALTVRAAAA
jgi:3-oxoacyl-(acyl-carrier-protein) synthase